MTEYKKGSAIVIINDKDEIALQLRAVNDDSFPSHWDFGAGGGIDEGEDEMTSAKREMQEELGVSTDVEFVSRQHYTYPAWKPGITREVDLWIYKTRHNGPFTPDMNEVEKVQFFSLEEIKKLVAENTAKFHPEFKLIWKSGIIDQALKN